MAHVGDDDGLRKIPAFGSQNHNTSWTISNLPEGNYYWSVQAIDTGFLGSNFAAEVTFETIPPSVTSLSPPDDEESADIGENLVMNFDENVFAQGGKNITIYNAGGSVFEQIPADDSRVAVSGSQVTINPNSDFVGAKSYYVQVDSGAFEDALGNDYAGINDDTTWNFTCFTPSVISLSPPDDGYVDTSENLVMNFDVNVFAQGGKNITIYNADGSVFEQIPADDVRVTISDSEVTINPDSDFVGGKSYYVQIDSGAFESDAGNDYAGINDDTTWNFICFIELTGVNLSSVAWGDYDNDADLDILLTGNTGHGKISKIYRNDSGNFTDIGAGLAGVTRGSVAWGDYDNDADSDILLTGRDEDDNPISKIYRNDSGSFNDIGANLTGVEESSVAWGDYDNDGDLDILLTGYSGGGIKTKVYRNDDGNFTNMGSLGRL